MLPFLCNPLNHRIIPHARHLCHWFMIFWMMKLALSANRYEFQFLRDWQIQFNHNVDVTYLLFFTSNWCLLSFAILKVAAENFIRKPYINWAVKRVARSLQVLWPRSRTSIYGSNATGLSLPSSDVDLVVSLPPVRNLVRKCQLLVISIFFFFFGIWSYIQ